MPLGDGCILLIGESFKFGFIQNEVLTGWDVVGDKFGILLTEVEDENRGVFKSCDSDIFRHRLFFFCSALRPITAGFARRIDHVIADKAFRTKDR